MSAFLLIFMMSFSEFASGTLFATALVASGVYAPDVIKAQMTFDSNRMIVVMMGASAVSSIVFDVHDRMKTMPKKHRLPSNYGIFRYDGNVVGGALMGIGMAVTGACPGTSLIQAGMGMQRGMLVVAGGVLGAAAFLQLQRKAGSLPSIHSDSSATFNPSTKTRVRGKPLDVPSILRIHPIVLLLLWVPMCIAVMGLAFSKDSTIRQTPKSGFVSPPYGGLLIGAAQLATTLLTRHAIGASGGYFDIARWISSIFQRRSHSTSAPSLSTPSIAFSGGVICAAATLSHFIHSRESLALRSVELISPTIAAQAFLGGFVMIIGAGLARGCTSGHGISGLSQFSLASLVTTAILFSAGIATSRLVGY